MKYDVTDSFRKYIKELRIKRGYTIEKMAYLCLLSERTIGDIENGKSKKVTEKTVEKFAKTLEIEFEELVTHCSEQQNKPGNLETNLGDAPYNIKEASEEDLRWIVNCHKKVYSEDDCIPFEKMLEWYNKNEIGFNKIVDNSERICGNLNILPLNDECLDRFLQGKILEKDILESDLVNDEDVVNNLYVESFVCIDNQGAFNNLAAYQTLMLADLILKRFNLGENVKIYAISANQIATQLLESLSFTRIVEGNVRLDSHAMFYIDYDTVIKKLLWMSNEERKPVFQNILDKLNVEADNL